MSLKMTKSRRLPALAAACLLSVALPAAPALAKEKTKPAPAASEAVKVDYSVSIPTIDAVDSNVSHTVLSAILSGGIADHAGELAGLDASRITVPEIVVSVSSQRGGTSHQSTLTFTDLVLENVVDGVAGSVSLSGTSMESDKATAEFGTISAANFSIAGMLGIYGLVESAPDAGLETIYTDFVAEGGSLDAEDVNCTIGGVSGAEFKARPLKTPFGEIMSLAQAMEDDADDIDPAVMAQLMRIYADIFTAFETSEVTFDGMACAGEDSQGRPMRFEIAGMAMGGMSPGLYPSIAVNGFQIAVEDDGVVGFDNLTIKPADLTGMISTLQSAPDDVDEAWLEANARGLIPAMQGLSFTGLAIDIPDPDVEDARIKADIGGFDLSLGNYFQGIPTDLDISATNIRATLPEDGDESFEQLRALGVTEINAGFRLSAIWDEETSTIDIREASVNDVNLASVSLAGTIANATADLFSLDEHATLRASMEMAVKALNLNVIDRGLSDIIIAQVAAEQGADPAAMRPIFAGLAQGTVIGMLAGAADAAKMGEAVNAFVAGKAKILEIGITAKTDPGLGMMDFMEAEENPASLLEKVNITAVSK